MDEERSELEYSLTPMAVRAPMDESAVAATEGATLRDPGVSGRLG